MNARFIAIDMTEYIYDFPSPNEIGHIPFGNLEELEKNYQWWPHLDPAHAANNIDPPDELPPVSVSEEMSEDLEDFFAEEDDDDDDDDDEIEIDADMELGSYEESDFTYSRLAKGIPTKKPKKEGGDEDDDDDDDDDEDEEEEEEEEEEDDDDEDEEEEDTRADPRIPPADLKV